MNIERKDTNPKAAVGDSKLPLHLLPPIGVAHAALAASSAAFSRWVSHPDEDILELIDASYAFLESGFRVRPSGELKD